MLWFMAANAVGPVELYHPRASGARCYLRLDGYGEESCGGAGFERLLVADIVAKVENRTTLKILRKSIIRLLCCCVAFQLHYGGP
jgi:hypothetical protein